MLAYKIVMTVFFAFNLLGVLVTANEQKGNMLMWVIVESLIVGAIVWTWII